MKSTKVLMVLFLVAVLMLTAKVALADDPVINSVKLDGATIDTEGTLAEGAMSIIEVTATDAEDAAEDGWAAHDASLLAAWRSSKS